jgi:hypothetical protein
MDQGFLDRFKRFLMSREPDVVSCVVALESEQGLSNGCKLGDELGEVVSKSQESLQLFFRLWRLHCLDCFQIVWV